MPESSGKSEDENSDEEQLPSPLVSKTRAESAKQPGTEADARLGRLRAKLDTVLGRGGTKKDDVDRDEALPQTAKE